MSLKGSCVEGLALSLWTFGNGLIHWWVYNFMGYWEVIIDIWGGILLKGVVPWRHALRDYILSLGLSSLAVSASWPPLDQRLWPLCSACHDVLSHHKHTMRPSEHGLTPLKPWTKIHFWFILRYFVTNMKMWHTLYIIYYLITFNYCAICEFSFVISFRQYLFKCLLDIHMVRCVYSVAVVNLLLIPLYVKDINAMSAV
jgi:hypothetical protein